MGENLGSDVAAILEVLSERCPPPGQNSIFRDRAMIIMTAVLVVLRPSHGDGMNASLSDAEGARTT